ncbi:hypothetical protein GP486_001851 [Trichoglossum hirsutum]|uniref:protein S-acyltransferase n=1 Tax=Trichoglossum hirsutum TaxID=265104 RepID=A0A9P8LFW7_9PEZI|nr:hypothetical protein GP486_001851 [Trichoglossum hirsutum]
MNPISSIVTLGWGAKKAVRVINNIRDAPDHVAALRDEISGFERLVEHAQKLLQRGDIPEGVLRSAEIKEAEETIQILNRKLESVLNTNTGTTNRFKWVQNESKCRKLQQRLRRHNQMLTNSIQVIQMNHFLRYPLVPELIIQRDQEMDGQVELVDLDAPRLVDDTLSSPRAEVESSQTTPPEPSSTLSEPPATYLEPSTARLSRQACRADCRCKCHTKTTYRWPDSLRPVIGNTFLSFVGQPTFVRRCSRRDCQKAKVWSGELSYVFPSWLLKKMISVSLISRGFKRTFHIRNHNIVSEFSDAVRYTCKGDLLGLQMLFSKRLATPNDTTPDGWTLMHPSDFAKFRTLNVNASQEEKELLRIFPNADEFKTDYELTPILVTVLHEYDASDAEPPKLSDLLDLADRINSANQGIDEDWHSWKRKYKNRSPLYLDMIESYRELAIAQPQERRIRQTFVNIPDATQRWSPVLWASFAGRTEELQTLLYHDADPFVISPSGRNALHHAAESKNPEMMKLLLDVRYRGRQIDVNLADNWSETPLHVAASKSAACVLLLLGNGARVNALQEDSQVPLHYAKLVKGREKHKIVDVLSLHQGVDVNVKDDGGRTPLSNVLDDPDCIDMLLDRGAKVGVPDNDGKTVLHHACLEDHPEALRTLLDRSPDVLAVQEDSSGSTPLLDAFRRGSACCARILLERELWGRFEDKDGWSLVHHAARMRDDDVLELALRHPDAHPGLRTKKGESVIDIAMDAGVISERAWALLRGPQRHQWHSDGREHADAVTSHLEIRR